MRAEPRTWTLSRFEDGCVCKAVGDFDKSSAVERIEVVEAIPLAPYSLPVHDEPEPARGSST